jgi:hypothetical protein
LPVAFAHLDRRRALAGHGFTRDVARTADVEHRILGHTAVQVTHRPVGRIHWAGTETAERWTGYIDGAIDSGQRVAAEVLDALGA